MFTYTIMFGYDPKYYEDFHMSGHVFQSVDDALKDALSWVNEDSIQDSVRVFIFNKHYDIVMRIHVYGDKLSA